MWYPFNFVNRRGVAVIDVANINVTADNVIFVLPDNSFRYLENRGVIYLKINVEIPTGTTTTLPVILQSNNTTLPLVNVGGVAITVADIPSTGVYQIYYDKSSNLLQLMTTTI